MTSREELLRAALDHGFVDLTVGHVTAGAGVKYSTFYRHFDSFVDLLVAMVDRVLDEAPGPLPDLETDWRAHLVGTSVTLAELVRTTPGLGEAFDLLPLPPVRLCQVRTRALELLAEAGFDEDDAEVGVDGLLAVVTADPRRVPPSVAPLIIEGLESRLHVGEHVPGGVEVGRG